MLIFGTDLKTHPWFKAEKALAHIYQDRTKNRFKYKAHSLHYLPFLTQN